MINVHDLSSNQCYLELPNGVIQLVELNSRKDDFSVVRILSETEVEQIRTELQLGVL